MGIRYYQERHVGLGVDGRNRIDTVGGNLLRTYPTRTWPGYPGVEGYPTDGAEQGK